MKAEIIKLLEKETKLKKEEIESLIEIPPQSELGDYAFPCFILAKKYKKNPVEISRELAEKIKPQKTIDKIQSEGAYLNFFINKKTLAESTIKEILTKKEKYGKTSIGKGKKIVIDMSSPNIAKPFGIGHLRSTIIGNSISKISEFQGYKTIKINYLGDWGTQFGKLIVGYKRFGSEKKLKESPINHLLEIYVKANKEEYEQEARDWFRKLEQGDKEAIKLWKKFKELSLKQFNHIYSMLNIKFDVISGESFYNKKMENTIKELEYKKLLEKSENALIVNLKEYNLGVCLIKKSDGATLYATRDITAAIDRYKKYKFNKMFYEVGAEQSLHFQQFLKVLELMGYNWAKNCTHISHGFYLDENGKKFATRKGKTVFMEDILNETIELAKKELEKRAKLSKQELEKRALKIAVAAIIYGDLKNYRINNMIFDIEKFLNFEGNTGPYLQYSYARACSIIRKAKSKSKNKTEIKDLTEKEIELIKKLSHFPDIAEKAYSTLNPSLIANYSFELSQIFNEFYHACPVINSENESFRLLLVQSFKIILKSALSLLGIDVLEEM